MNYSNIKKLNNFFLAGGLCLLIVLVSFSCKKDAVQTLPSRSWDLVWSDDFDGTAGQSPDPSKWSFDIGNSGWGNSELQYYTDRPQNVSLDGNGNLIITAKRETFGGASFTSARINSKGKFTQTYGRIEARLKTPYGPGLWPAFWMLGANIDEVTWPQCGEIDIMEQRGQQPYVNNGSVHGPGYSGGSAITKSYGLMDGRFDTDFHIYAIEWTENQIDFFVDNFLYQRIKPENVTGTWVYDHPFYLILNIAVGGNYVGFPTTGTPFPQTMEVDYIKVYDQKK